MKDLDKFRRKMALYTPAASPAYVKPMSLEENSTKLRSMNWLNADAPFHYPWSLYSAGHAFLDIEKSDERESFIQNRDRDHSIVIGDSGGYQIATGKINFDWDNFDTEVGPSNKKVTRIQLLRWLEHTADIAMTLDYPTWVLSFGKRKTTPLKSKEQCFEGTEKNLQFFIENRDPDSNTKFLNVLQGRNREEAEEWYNMAKKYEFEGWAFAGPTRLSLAEGLPRLIMMRDEKQFENGKDWIHFLGISKISAGLAFTALQTVMRKHINEKIQISYDSASPFLMAAFGSSYYSYVMNNEKLSMQATKTPKAKNLIDYDGVWPWYSPVQDEFKVSDFVGEKQKHLWTLEGYLFQMYNNTYQMCKALMEAKNIYLLPRCCKNEQVPDLKKMIPNDILQLEEILSEIFTSETPHDLIKENALLLNSVISPALDASLDNDLFVKESSNFLRDHENDQDEVDRIQETGSRGETLLEEQDVFKAMMERIDND